MSYAIEVKRRKEGDLPLFENIVETTLVEGAAFQHVHVLDLVKGTASSAWAKVVDKGVSTGGYPVYLIVSNAGTAAITITFNNGLPATPGTFKEHVIMPDTQRVFEMPSGVDVYLKTLAGSGDPL